MYVTCQVRTNQKVKGLTGLRNETGGGHEGKFRVEFLVEKEFQKKQ